ncbi:hypothetical protein CWM85_10565 [Klebsiella michiganensis]|uniref:Uncharacterized protein n=1 Tax=Klebsiella michiganensis TaxID=1134687 RepID=A0A2J4ZR61_9ENTR|nr:hypothetical protein CWM85_10565 [Klebsiella michiganensis]
MMSLWDALRMNMMISYQELVRTFLRLGLFLLSVIQSRNPGLPSDTILTCMRLNASARSQK